ncbi:MAG: TRAP transporter large permease [Deltaproteobacteria bacterium]|nr:TRAP transporter large permease [Deltaproteobacteria bacterium]MBW2122779.1 TRAP transporter large permease [Deltaproteobacteria bacterium]
MVLFLTFIILIALILMGVPVAFSMGLSGLFALLFGHAPQLIDIIAQRMYAGTTSYILLAIPFFIFAGLLMNAGGMTQRILKFTTNLIGHVTGGLGHVNVIASMIFSGMSGSAVADASGLGTVEMKVMTDAGYDRTFSAAITAASSTVGPVIPPSIPFVIYGGLTGVSVGRLFLAGFVPGLFMGIGLMIAVYIISQRRRFPKTLKRAPVKDLLASTKDALLALGTPVIIIGGIVTGVFTPTEAGVVASLYAVFLGAYAFRELNLEKFLGVVWETIQNSVRILFIIAAASFLSWVVSYFKGPEVIVSKFLAVTDNPIFILFLINGLLLVLGCFLEGISIMLLVVPVFMPLIGRLGIDPVHFGVIVTLNLMIALITPPMGLSLYSVSVIAKTPIGPMIREIVPYLIALLAVLFLITVWPASVLFIPRLFMQ